MSIYHVLGIARGNTMEAIASGDVEDQVLRDALPFVCAYPQMFLVKKGGGIREVVFVPPSEGGLVAGGYAPKVRLN